MKLPLYYYGHPVLRVKAKPIEKITPEVLQLVADMLETMTSMGNAIGLAANQVGQLVRIFMIREETQQENGTYSLGAPEIFINPVLSQPSEEAEVMQEGCLSIPKIYCNVVRPKKIHISYLNLRGERVEEDAEGFRARQLMHENDHLNGVLMVDRMDPLERKKIEHALQTMKKRMSGKSGSID